MFAQHIVFSAPSCICFKCPVVPKAGKKRHVLYMCVYVSVAHIYRFVTKSFKAHLKKV